MFDLSKMSNNLLLELCNSELDLKKCNLCDFQLLEDIAKEMKKRGLNKAKKKVGKKK